VIAIVAANWTSSYCDVYLASQFFECEPVGVIDDLGHALLSLAAIPIVLTLSYPFAPGFTVWISRFGAAVMVTLAAMYLLLAARLLDHTLTVAPLLLAWSLFGIWLIAERGFTPGVTLFGILLGVTVLIWALAFRTGVANDAVRVAGGGLFVAGYPLWLGYAGRSPRVVTHRRAPPWLVAVRLIGVAAITLVGGLPLFVVWLGATVGGPIIGDPAFFLTVTNATEVAVRVPDDGRLSSVAPGATAQISWGSYGRFIATTADGTPIYCRDISTYDRLRMRARVTVTRDTSSCEAP
jgi:hypothetical protein